LERKEGIGAKGRKLHESSFQDFSDGENNRMNLEKKACAQGEELASRKGSFFRLMDAHEAQETLFHRHQCSLVDREVPKSLLLLKEYRAMLLQHMRDEEEVLIPIYEKGPIQAGGKSEYFVQEHRKLLDFLDRIKEAMEVLEKAEGEAWYRALFEVLDLETTFKNIGEHHEAREEQFLFPGLNALLTGKERELVLARCECLARLD
jgi:hemerythrin-like domain-containing protein